MVSLYPDLSEPWSDDEEPLSQSALRGRDSLGLSRSQRPTPNSCSNHLGGENSGNRGGRGESGVRREEGSDSINLDEFQEFYLRNAAPPVPTASDEAPVQRRSASFKANPGRERLRAGEDEDWWSRGKMVVSAGVRWVAGARWWKKALLGSLLGLVFAAVLSELQLGKTRKDNLLPCSSSDQHLHTNPCLTLQEAKSAKLLADIIVNHLHTRAGQYICGAGDIPSLSVPLSELKPLFHTAHTHVPIEHVIYLFLYNPHWNIRWMNPAEEVLSDHMRLPRDADLLVSLRPSISLYCRMMLSVAQLWRYVRIAVIIALLLLFLLCAVVYLYRRRQREKAAVFAMVGRIMDVMKYHYKKSQAKPDLLQYLAIIHVRDMLIPPSERKEKKLVWEKAVEWISSHESRVRVENRRIAGEDFQVWRWIQEAPPPTEEPSSLPGLRGNWCGSVFDHYPPEVTTRVAPPTGTPSLCIRLKNMFESTKHMEEAQCRELETAVLERCAPHGVLVHVYIDKRSPYGCAYLKMKTLKSAMAAYKVLHGGWYKGKLVTAKYIPESKYHKWFPQSSNINKPFIPA